MGALGSLERAGLAHLVASCTLLIRDRRGVRASRCPTDPGKTDLSRQEHGLVDFICHGFLLSVLENILALPPRPPIPLAQAMTTWVVAKGPCCFSWKISSIVRKWLGVLGSPPQPYRAPCTRGGPAARTGEQDDGDMVTREGSGARGRAADSIGVGCQEGPVTPESKTRLFLSSRELP